MPKIANVYQDKKNKKWYFVASLGFDEKGKRVQHWERGFQTQKEAKSGYDDYMNDYSKTAIKKNSSMSYQEFYTTYFETDYKRSVKKRTYDNRVSSMRIHFAYFYKRKLNEISPPMIKKWQNELSEKYSSAYIRNIYGLFQMSLDLAVKLGLLQKNVAKQVGNVKKNKKKVDFWTQSEFEKVIATFDTSDYYQNYSFMLVWLLFMTGLRFGEAQALEWDNDIDFENKTLRVNKSMYYKNAEEYYITEPKTTASNRVIAIDSDTIRYLKNWKIAQEKCGGSKWILSYNGLPTNKSAPYHIIQRHSKLAGVHRIKTHALRHSHASLLISLGENAIVVRDRLGHEDIKTTLGTYGHLYPNTNIEVANRLVGLINVEMNEKAIKETKKFSGNQYIKKEGK